MAKRVQLKRSKGWRMPPNTVKVDRTTRWGNPYKLTDYQFANPDGTPAPWNESTAREMSLRDFEHALRVGMLRVSVADVHRELSGKDLACWCKPGDLCHADVLLEIANECAMRERAGKGDDT